NGTTLTWYNKTLRQAAQSEIYDFSELSALHRTKAPPRCTNLRSFCVMPAQNLLLIHTLSLIADRNCDLKRQDGILCVCAVVFGVWRNVINNELHFYIY